METILIKGDDKMIRLFNYEDKKIIYEDDQTKADELINSGKAIKLDLSELDKYEKKSNEIYENYRKEVDRIKNSDNPLLQDDKVQQYELNRLKEDYEQKSAEVEREYLAYRNKAIEDAKVKAARAVVKVSD